MSEDNFDLNIQALQEFLESDGELDNVSTFFKGSKYLSTLIAISYPPAALFAIGSEIIGSFISRLGKAKVNSRLVENLQYLFAQLVDNIDNVEEKLEEHYEELKTNLPIALEEILVKIVNEPNEKKRQFFNHCLKNTLMLAIESGDYDYSEREAYIVNLFSEIDLGSIHLISWIFQNHDQFHEKISLKQEKKMIFEGDISDIYIELGRDFDPMRPFADSEFDIFITDWIEFKLLESFDTDLYQGYIEQLISKSLIRRKYVGMRIGKTTLRPAEHLLELFSADLPSIYAEIISRYEV